MAAIHARKVELCSTPNIAERDVIFIRGDIDGITTEAIYTFDRNLHLPAPSPTLVVPVGVLIVMQPSLDPPIVNVVW